MNPKDYMKKDKLIDMFIQTSISGFIMFIIFWFGVRDTDAREMVNKVDKKADIEYVDKINENIRKYVDDEFQSHIYQEQQAFKSLEKIMQLNIQKLEEVGDEVKSNNKQTYDMLDYRLKRLESKTD